MDTDERGAFAYAVIVTTYRRPGFLAQTLHGIAAQTLKPSCVIVADDGSDEPHRSKNQALTEQYGFIYLPLQHSGLPGMARDRALALVVEPWVALSDDDDVWDADHIERLAQHIKADIAIVAGNARRSDTNQPYRAALPPTIDVAREFPSNPVINSAAIVRHESLIAIGGFAAFPRGAEDYTTWLRLGDIGRTAIVNEPTITYRITEGSISAEMSGARRPLPLLCACDYLVWSAGKRLRLNRMGTRFWTTVAGLFVRRAHARRDR